MRRLWIIATLLIVLFSLVACASPATVPSAPAQSPAQTQQAPESPKTTPAPTQAPKQTSPSKANSPTNIAMFSSIQEGELNRFYFLLEGTDGTNITADGHVQLEVFDDTNNSLYLKEFDVNASEYVEYQFKLTGQNVGEAYEWRIPTTDIKKGISSIGLGRAVLTFTTVDGKKLTAEDKTIQIPVYTDSELKQMAEEEYAKVAVSLSQKISKGKFEVKVTGAGFFSPYEWGTKKQYFRIDMEVRNIGNAADYFSPLGMVILDNQGNQYETSYGGSLDTISHIYPNVLKKGYILFEGVPKTLGSAKLTFQLGYDAQFEPYLFEYNIQLK
jgi:hypothetical protein